MQYRAQQDGKLSHFWTATGWKSMQTEIVVAVASVANLLLSDAFGPVSWLYEFADILFLTRRFKAMYERGYREQPQIERAYLRRQGNGESKFVVRSFAGKSVFWISIFCSRISSTN